MLRIQSLSNQTLQLKLFSEIWLKMPIPSQMDPIFTNFHLTKYGLCLWKSTKTLWAQRMTHRVLNLTCLKGEALKKTFQIRILIQVGIAQVTEKCHNNMTSYQWVWICFPKETSQKCKFFPNFYKDIVWVDKWVQVLPNSNLSRRKINKGYLPKMVHLAKISSIIKCYMNRKREIWRGRQRKAKHSITMATRSSSFTLLVHRMVKLHTLQACTPLTSIHLTTSTLTCHLTILHMASLLAPFQFSHHFTRRNHQQTNKWLTRKWCPV